MSSIVCFYHSEINVSLLNSSLPTHILYTSIGLDFDGNIKFPFGDDIQILSELNFLDKMRHMNSDLKILISFSDIDDIQQNAFNAMLGRGASRKNFAKNVVGFCKKCNLDGVDLNCQRPQKKNRENFLDLLKRIKDLMSGVTHLEKTLHSSSQNIFLFGDTVDPQILSVTLNGGTLNSYKLKEIAKKAKFINLMCFDLENSKIDVISVDWAVNFCINEGLHLNRINIGIAMNGSNDTRSIEAKSSYVKFGGFCGIALYSFDSDDYAKGFPLIRAAAEVINRKKRAIVMMG
jgi:GH18 family chitinase